MISSLEGYALVRDEYNLNIIDLKSGIAYSLASNIQCNGFSNQMDNYFDMSTSTLNVITVQLINKNSRIVKLKFNTANMMWERGNDIFVSSFSLNHECTYDWFD